MKNYRQLVQELPSKTVVFVFGRFNPPTSGHELLFKMVKKIAMQNKADHVIYASRTQDKKKNPLPVDRKMHYLKMMFKGFNFVAANPQERSFIEAATHLNKKYKNIIMVAGSDRVAEYERILNRYNGQNFKFDTIQVVSAGERDPDSDTASGMSASKMRQFAEKGNFMQFKRGLPNSVRDIDARLLMNELRQAMGLDAIKEEVKFSIDTLRDKYFKGEIYHIGDIVESNGAQYEIIDRGSNYVTVVNDEGKLSRKWIQDIKVIGSLVEQDINVNRLSYKGFVPQNIQKKINIVESFKKTLSDKTITDPLGILNALKLTDSYMKMNESASEEDLHRWDSELERARESLENINQFHIHESYWNTYRQELNAMMDKKIEEGLTNITIKSADKIKVARIIADMLGVENAEKMSSPSQLINMGMRKVKNKPMRPELANVLSKMLKLADDIGVKYDKGSLPPKLRESVEVKKNTGKPQINDILRYSDFLKLDKMNKGEVEAEKEKDKGHKVDNGEESASGHKLDNNTQLRRRKYMYATEEVDHAKLAKMHDHHGNSHEHEVTNGGHEDHDYVARDHFNAADKHRDAHSALKKHGANSDHYKKAAANAHKASEDAKDAAEMGPKFRKTTKPNSIKEDVGTSDYKLSKSGRKVPAKVLHDKDAKKIANDDENEREKRKKEKDLEAARKGEPVDEAVMDVHHNELDCWDADGKKVDCKDVPEKEVDDIVNSLTDDDMMDAYDDEELEIVDDETGEKVSDVDTDEEGVNEEALNEVLSRAERIKAKIRFARHKAKRARKLKIALKRRSTTGVVNRRARRLAVKLLKKRLAKKPLNKLSVGEKERIERIIKKRSQLIKRIGMKLVPRIRKVETSRLQGKKAGGAPKVGGF
jgi:nicotinic acid mononucleotide adenylyltransferase